MPPPAWVGWWCQGAVGAVVSVAASTPWFILAKPAGTQPHLQTAVLVSEPLQRDKKYPSKISRRHSLFAGFVCVSALEARKNPLCFSKASVTPCQLRPGAPLAWPTSCGWEASPGTGSGARVWRTLPASLMLLPCQGPASSYTKYWM